MKLLSLLNPQKWLGQIAVIGCFFFMGVSAALYYNECPATTQINNDVKNKVKKGGLIESSLSTSNHNNNCIEWLRGLDKSERRAIIKQLK